MESRNAASAGSQDATPPPISKPAVPEGSWGPEPNATGKADLTKRFLAALIDGVIASVVGLVPVIGGLVGAAYMLVRDGLDLDFMRFRSIGKQVMNLAPTRLDGRPMDLEASVKRNLPFAIGPLIMVIPILGWIIGPFVSLAISIVEIVLVITDPEGRRLGDKLAETKVVEV
ncbi:MAG: RDD family protein [Bacteroidota bacterium]